MLEGVEASTLQFFWTLWEFAWHDESSVSLPSICVRNMHVITFALNLQLPHIASEQRCIGEDISFTASKRIIESIIT